MIKIYLLLNLYTSSNENFQNVRKNILAMSLERFK